MDSHKPWSGMWDHKDAHSSGFPFSKFHSDAHSSGFPFSKFHSDEDRRPSFPFSRPSFPSMHGGGDSDHSPFNFFTKFHDSDEQSSSPWDHSMFAHGEDRSSFAQGGDQTSMPFVLMSHGPSMGMPMVQPPMMSYGRSQMYGPPPMFGMGTYGPQQLGSSGPSPLGGILQALIQAKLSSANSADSGSNDYDYDSTSQDATPPPMVMPSIIQSMMAARAQQSPMAGGPSPMLMPAIMQSMMAARAQAEMAQSQLAQPHMEIAFKAPAVVPATPVEVSPASAVTPSKQASGPDNDQITFRSGP